jgi:hypothetical protein
MFACVVRLFDSSIRFDSLFLILYSYARFVHDLVFLIVFRLFVVRFDFCFNFKFSYSRFDSSSNLFVSFCFRFVTLFRFVTSLVLVRFVVTSFVCFFVVRFVCTSSCAIRDPIRSDFRFVDLVRFNFSVRFSILVDSCLFVVRF